MQGLACLRLVDWAWFAEQGDEAQRLIDRAIAVIPADPPTPTPALALAWRALLLAEGGFEQAPRLAAEAEKLARSCGAERAEAHAALTQATFRCSSGTPTGLAELRARIGPARSLRCALVAGRAYHNLAAYPYQFGRYTDVLELEPEALEFCAAAGIYWVASGAARCRCAAADRLCFGLGRFDPGIDPGGGVERDGVVRRLRQRCDGGTAHRGAHLAGRLECEHGRCARCAVRRLV